jgi:GNAT superfamily N-acetyltransferase
MLSIAIADEPEADDVAAMRTRVAEDMTRRFGRGHWSATASAASVLSGIRTSRVVNARDAGELVGTLRLATKKPWAIDPTYFAKSVQPIYLLDMAVSPPRQRQGIGRALMAAAAQVVRDWGGDAIRLDAYDNEAGAGPFYERCGYRDVGHVVYRGVPLIYFELVL